MTDVDRRAAAWRLFIENSARVQTAADERLRVRHDLSLADYHVLLLLSEAPEHRLASAARKAMVLRIARAAAAAE